MGMGSVNNLEQAGFRGRFDDGVESLQESDGGATWIAALNTDWSQKPDDTFRMRILIGHPSVPGRFDNFITMRYSLNSAPYLLITNTSLVVRLIDTVHWVHGDDSTDFVGRLGTGNWGGIGAGALMDDAALPSFRFDAPAFVQREVETEWSLQLMATDVVQGDTIDFRCFKNPSDLFTRGYTFTPRLTVDATDMIKFESGSLQNVCFESRSLQNVCFESSSV